MVAIYADVVSIFVSLGPFLGLSVLFWALSFLFFMSVTDIKGLKLDIEGLKLSFGRSIGPVRSNQCLAGSLC